MAIFSLTTCHLPSVSICVPISSYKDTSPTGWGPTLMASLYLICFFKDPHLKYSHIFGGTVGLGCGWGKHLNIWIWEGYNSAHNTPHSSMLPSWGNNKHVSCLSLSFSHFLNSSNPNANWFNIWSLKWIYLLPKRNQLKVRANLCT